MNRKQFINSIIEKYNLQQYGFEEGFHQFEKRCFSCLDKIENESFDWITESGNAIIIPVTIIAVAVEFDEENEPCLYDYLYQ